MSADPIKLGLLFRNLGKWRGIILKVLNNQPPDDETEALRMTTLLQAISSTADEIHIDVHAWEFLGFVDREKENQEEGFFEEPFSPTLPPPGFPTGFPAVRGEVTRGDDQPHPRAVVLNEMIKLFGDGGSW